MFGLGGGEIVLILVIALVLLGPKRLPDLAVNIGKGIREFNRARQGLMDSIERPMDSTNSSQEKSSLVSPSASVGTNIDLNKTQSVVSGPHTVPSKEEDKAPGAPTEGTALSVNKVDEISS